MYVTRRLLDDAQLSGNGDGKWSNESVITILEESMLQEGEGLTKEVLDRFKAFRQKEEDEVPRGVYVMIPPMFDHLRDEIEPRLLDVGVHIIPYESAVEEKKTMVVGAAGFPAMLTPLLSGWNERDAVDLKPTELDPFGPTPMRRGGNNKPWIDVALQKRRAKIAKQSKRRNRK